MHERTPAGSALPLIAGLLTAAALLAPSLARAQCPSGYYACGDAYCAADDHVCCANAGHPESSCPQGYACTYDGQCQSNPGGLGTCAPGRAPCGNGCCPAGYMFCSQGIEGNPPPMCTMMGGDAGTTDPNGCLPGETDCNNGCCPSGYPYCTSIAGTSECASQQPMDYSCSSGTPRYVTCDSSAPCRCEADCGSDSDCQSGCCYNNLCGPSCLCAGEGTYELSDHCTDYGSTTTPVVRRSSGCDVRPGPSRHLGWLAMLAAGLVLAVAAFRSRRRRARLAVIAMVLLASAAVVSCAQPDEYPTPAASASTPVEPAAATHVRWQAVGNVDGRTDRPVAGMWLTTVPVRRASLAPVPVDHAASVVSPSANLRR